MEIVRFVTADAPPGWLEQARALMDVAFDGDFDETDWDHALGIPSHRSGGKGPAGAAGGRGAVHVVAVESGRVLGHASVVLRTLWVGEEAVSTGYVEAVAVGPERQGRGIGTAIMDEIGRAIRERYEMGGLGTDLFGFYGRLGWERWVGETWVRDGERWWRSPDEDGYVMVLRFGASAGLALDSSICCEARPGDDW